MVWQFSKMFIAAGVISFTAWLSGRQPKLAGFLLALPLSTLMALAFGQIEYQDPGKSVTFAKSVFLALPASLLFFVPFLFADRLQLGFWALYGIGLALLSCGYLLHSWLLG